jgi:hypothetical protein
MHDCVGGLTTVPRLEVGHEVQSPAVVGAVVVPAERDHAVAVVAAAERARDDVRRVDLAGGAAHDAGTPGDLVALGLRGGQRR